MKLDLTSLLPTALKPYAKYVYALLGIAAFLVADGTLTGETAQLITKIVALVTVPGAVYGAENRDAEPGTDEVPVQDVHEEPAEEGADPDALG